LSDSVTVNEVDAGKVEAACLAQLEFGGLAVLVGLPDLGITLQRDRHRFFQREGIRVDRRKRHPNQQSCRNGAQ
jgi:hypothetical protein